MKTIELANGKGSVSVDDEDYEAVAAFGWCLHVHRARKRTVRYAQANIKVDGTWRRVLMHRFLLAAGRSSLVDHVDGNGLNNVRTNLRLANHGSNQHNSGPRTGKFKGVSWHAKAKKWVAQIMANCVRRHLGLFVSEEEAAKAYDGAAKELHRDFARLNFPEAVNVPRPV